MRVALSLGGGWNEELLGGPGAEFTASAAAHSLSCVRQCLRVNVE